MKSILLNKNILGFIIISLVVGFFFVNVAFAQSDDVEPYPTEAPLPTPIPIPGHTIVSFTLFLHGIGKGGDNANPGSTGNTSPLHPQRTILVEMYNGRTELLMQQEGTIAYNPSAGNFSGYVDLGRGFPTGSYYIKVRTAQFLRKQVGLLQNITTNTTNKMPVLTLIVGDTSGDNKINILDYNQIIRCFSNSRLCTPIMRETTDINDDGKVNGVDYNLFLREVWIQPGQ